MEQNFKKPCNYGIDKLAWPLKINHIGRGFNAWVTNKNKPEEYGMIFIFVCKIRKFIQYKYWKKY